MKYINFLLFFLFQQVAFAQNSPVSWDFSLNKTSESKAEFLAKANIAKGWNIYGVYMGNDGPVPTSFDFTEITLASLDGNIVEKSLKISVYDDLFEMDVIKFKEQAEFVQSINAKSGTKIKGTVLFMCCDSKRCLPPASVPFDLKL